MKGLGEAGRVPEVVAEMKRRNPNWPGFLSVSSTAVRLHPGGLTDLTPLRLLDQLREFAVGKEDGPPEPSPLASLEPLRGLPLNVVWMAGTQVNDLSPLAGMPIHTLSVAESRAGSFVPLARAPIQTLQAKLSQFHVQGWSIVRRWPLKRVDLHDYKPTEAARLEQLLTERPMIVEVSCAALASPAGDATGDDLRAVLRKHPRLRLIQGKPAAEYWKGF